MLYQSQDLLILSDVGYSTNKVTTYLRDCLTNSTWSQAKVLLL